MYFPDGQIRDEVYVYGSFLQSKMHNAGVTCSDCHEPHNLQLKIPGNGICLQCHLADQYESSSHHFHKLDDTGASCVECHMPPRTYMVVDPRHDHSMRIPRPDLSEKLGTPNACSNCHADKNLKWAADYFRKWYPGQPKGFQTYAETLATARDGYPGTEKRLADLIRNVDTPDIARATALSVMANHLGPDSLDTLQIGLDDDNPVMRVATIEAMQSLPLDLRAQIAFSLLEDPVRAVRVEAAHALAQLPLGQLPEKQQSVLDRAIKEYIEAQQSNAERPEAQANLGNLLVSLGRTVDAKKAYQTAIDLNPVFIPGYVNLADLYRNQGDEGAGEQVLRQALAAAPGNAIAQQALGLSLVRQKRLTEAVEVLRLSSLAAPENAHYVYVYAVALNSTGQQEKAISILEGAQKQFPKNTSILTALVAFHRNLGNEQAASRYASKLQAL